MNFAHSTSLRYSMSKEARIMASGKYSSVVSLDLRQPTNIQEPKTLFQLARICFIAFGIEFCDAAEKALVTPMLLKLGIPVLYMTYVWALSPIFGLTIGPVFGALSDKCRSEFGKRKPFIFIFSAGIMAGLILLMIPGRHDINGYDYVAENITIEVLNTSVSTTVSTDTTSTASAMNSGGKSSFLLVLFLTIIGATIVDICINISHSPARAYLFEVIIPEDHQKGLSTLTLMAGVGGSVGFIIAGIDWGNSFFEGQERFVFGVALLAITICAILTLTAEKEASLTAKDDKVEMVMSNEHTKEVQFTQGSRSYGSVHAVHDVTRNNKTISNNETQDYQASMTFRTYLKSVLNMPRSLLILCVTHMFCWMSIHCYCLFFTDFVGQTIYEGDPTAPLGSEAEILYNAGVRFGSFVSSLYLLSCAGYSVVIEHLVERFGAKWTYICSQLVYTFGSVIVATFSNQMSAGVVSITAGIMYATLFNVPFMLVVHYTDSQYSMEEGDKTKQNRGLGTDVAILVSIVFAGQLVVSTLMGPLVFITSSTKTVMVCAAIFSACGAATATKVSYLDL